jgi:hypothetical protein
MGSIELARRAGIVQAKAAQRMKRAATATRISGLQSLFWVQWARSLWRVRRIRSPARAGAAYGDADVAVDNREYVRALSSKSHADYKLIGTLGDGG